ncbi:MULTISPECIES: hypothetical protein [Vibrio]|nr:MULTISPECIES: hypothetical protein [Vibrio]MDW2259795.1 hypothetical protein [Vibrio sp. 1409]EGQ7649513.1 hypothetical protein [Vibrio alginolyticus]EGQ7763480.1 hypothetical protein [Vibrio alginolyticus]EJE8521008.1 hypothetical protein [Vibrio parahaemolyticus]EJT1897084.1 hypothetical protein [Vibrio alginolyticus]
MSCFVSFSGGDLGKAVTSVNDKARLAKNQGEMRNLSLGQDTEAVFT